MSAPDPISIARRLTRGQRSTIAQLDGEFSMLGCAEETAKRLAIGGPRRPALTVRRQGDRHPEFALNEIGMAVKEVL